MFQVPQHDIQIDNPVDNELSHPNTSQVCLKKTNEIFDFIYKFIQGSTKRVAR